MRSVSNGNRRLTHAALSARQIALGKLEVTRKDLATAARDAMKALDLRPSLRLVLAELVGCWGEKPIGDRLLVWPSNDYIVQRTGLSERAVRYAVRALTDQELVTAKDSANGKRFARMTAGVVTEVFGFDLTPLYARRREWADQVAAKKLFRETQNKIHDEITINRRASEEALTALCVEYPTYDRTVLTKNLEEICAQVPRRGSGISLEALEGVLTACRSLRERSEQAYYLAGCGGNQCRHKETNNENSDPEACNNGFRMEAGAGSEPDLSLILEACPALSLYGRPIVDDCGLIAAAAYLRASLGAHQSAWDEAVKVLGARRAAIAVAIVLQLHADDEITGANLIKNPGGYFRALVRLIAAKRYSIRMELMTLRRRHLE